ncbi:flagellin [Roseospirillum parvum]|uniref:Flagellin FlgL n=1 Tax=Roseospirillum parvum TaxID=83401 RepID=A0A1G8FU64_9PROT|nr:flagellin [Roseospirillum parvum]SDH85637.1 Flagellin FlgL [Roseospirillum parvum]
MVSRVATANSRMTLVSRMLEVQARVQETQKQISTEKKSLDYKGIANDSYRLVSMENERTMFQRYQASNEIAQTNLAAMANSVESAEDTLREFRGLLSVFSQRDLSNFDGEDEAALEDLQQDAFETMQALEFFMDLKVDGKYLFSGGKSDTPPIELGFQTVDEFQEYFDGTDVTYPETRAAHLAEVSLSDTDTGNLTFAAGPPGTIAATNPGSLSDLPVGAVIEVTGSGSNNRSFTVTANNGTTLEVSPPPTAEGPVGGVSIDTRDTYYNGDELEMRHRVDTQRSITLGINAKDAAIEKAIRGLGIVAQGVPQLTNPTPPPATTVDTATLVQRIEQGLDLLNDALEHPIDSTEEKGDFQRLARQIGSNQVTLNNAIDEQKTYVSFLEVRIIDIENVDITEAATRLNDDLLSLDISMATLARISQLSLNNYL